MEAQNRMKMHIDKKRTEHVFEEGDWVYLKLQPYKQKILVMRKNMNLVQRYYGPFQVEKRVDNVAYWLKLPHFSKTHVTFHFSCLKKKLGFQIQPFTTYCQLILSARYF